MKDTQNTIIVMLLVTAAILAALLVVSLNSPQAQADVSVRAGDYIMFSGAFTRTNDFIYVIDVGMRRINVYTINIQKSAIDMIDSVELEKLFVSR